MNPVNQSKRGLYRGMRDKVKRGRSTEANETMPALCKSRSEGHQYSTIVSISQKQQTGATAGTIDAIVKLSRKENRPANEREACYQKAPRLMPPSTTNQTKQNGAQGWWQESFTRLVLFPSSHTHAYPPIEPPDTPSSLFPLPLPLSCPPLPSLGALFPLV